MIGGPTAQILLSAFIVIDATQVPLRISLTVVDLGDNLTLTCPIIQNGVGLFYWYKLNFGYMIQTIASGTFHTSLTLQEQFSRTRFDIKVEDNLQLLIIRNVSKEDEAMYFCQAGTAYEMEFFNGTLLALKDHKNLHNTYVKQSPETASVQLGDSVPLQCSLLSKNNDSVDQCLSERRVYWFRAESGGYHPAIVHSSRSDEEEEKSCVYSLSKTIENPADTGIYYCAVVTCGKILLGGGTKVETRQELCPSNIALGLLLPCLVITIAALILTRNRKSVCEHRRGEATTSDLAEDNTLAEDQQGPMEDDETEGLKYAALDFSSRKAKRLKANGEFSQRTYSAMRASEMQL